VPSRLIGLDSEPIAIPTTAASLLDLDAELADGLSRDATATARSRLTVAVLSLEPGPWNADSVPHSRRSSFGVLVVSGLLTRQVTIPGGGALELFGPSDIVDPWAEAGTGMLEAASSWRVVTPARVAVLDPRVVATMVAWPRLVESIVARAGCRATRLAVHQAISQLPRVEQRVLAVLWHLAERWGRVTAEGVAVALPLSHGALGGLVGARRPTVSLAIKELADQDLLARRPDGAWLLLGQPPAEEELARARRLPRGRRVMELRPVNPPVDALAERVVALRSRYERNLHVARDGYARAEAARAKARRLVSQPRLARPAERADPAAPPG